MFGHERMLCFVDGLPEDGFDIQAPGSRFRGREYGQ